MDTDPIAALEPEEALALALAGAPGEPHPEGVSYRLPDGSLLVLSDEDPADEVDPREEALLAILADHDPAGIEDGDGQEYRAEARDLAGRLAEHELQGPDEVAEVLSAVLTHWFSAEDGTALMSFSAAVCRPAAGDIWALIAPAA